MSTVLNQRSPVAKAGWLIGLFLVGWLAFLFLPLPRPPPEPLPPLKVRPPSKLEQVGLRDYTDWAGLPEFFAIWAEQADWKDGRTRFAYWHPVMRDYSYYFEAVRVKEGYRFREITEPRAPGYGWDESLGEECPIRFFKPVRPELSVAGPAPSVVEAPVASGNRPRVPVVIPAAKLPPPDPKP
jgi:hypothetical protein